MKIISQNGKQHKQKLQQTSSRLES